MTKGYTISLFIREIKKLPDSVLTTEKIYQALSPKYGYWGTKAIMLDVWTQGYMLEILEGKTTRAKALGKTPRARVLQALKNRKKFARKYAKQIKEYEGNHIL